MKTRRFTEDQICAIKRLDKDGRLLPYAQDNARLFTKKSQVLEVSDARRLKALEDENHKLKKLLA